MTPLPDKKLGNFSIVRVGIAKIAAEQNRSIVEQNGESNFSGLVCSGILTPQLVYDWLCDLIVPKESAAFVSVGKLN